MTFLQSPLKEEGLEIPTSLVEENSRSGSLTMVVSILGLVISEVDISDLFLGSMFHFISVLACEKTSNLFSLFFCYAFKYHKDIIKREDRVHLVLVLEDN